MTTEEKARAWDEALEKAKSALDNTESGVTAGILRDIFPQLKESEDERIKKKIIYLVTKSHEQGGYALHKDEAETMLAWIEKQGEKKPVEWSKEDKKKLDAVIDIIDSYPIRQLRINGLPTNQSELVSWLKSLRPQKHWKPSDDQIEALNQAVDFFGCGDTTKYVGKHLKGLLEQLKAL